MAVSSWAQQYLIKEATPWVRKAIERLKGGSRVSIGEWPLSWSKGNPDSWNYERLAKDLPSALKLNQNAINTRHSVGNLVGGMEDADVTISNAMRKIRARTRKPGDVPMPFEDEMIRQKLYRVWRRHQAAINPVFRELAEGKR